MPHHGATVVFKESHRYSGEVVFLFPGKGKLVVVTKWGIIRVPVCEEILKPYPLPFWHSIFTWRMQWESCLTFHMALCLNQVVHALAKSHRAFVGVPAGFFKVRGE